MNQTNKKDKANMGYVTLLTMVATLGGLLFGYDTAVISGAIDYLKVYFELNDAETGFAAASILLGCAVGALLIAGWMSSKFGRRNTLMFAALLFLGVSIGTAIPVNYMQLVTARFLGGIGVGIASMVSPMYISEIAPAKIRGRLVSFNQLAIVGGIMLAYFVNYWIKIPDAQEVLWHEAEGVRGAVANMTASLTDLPEDMSWNLAAGWRYMFLAMGVPSALFFILLFFVPESPRFLAIRDKYDKSMDVLTKLNGITIATKVMNDIKASITKEREKISGKVIAPGMLIAIIVGSLLSIFQQVTGINVILYYAPTIMKSMGSSSDQAFFETVIVGGVNVLFTIVAILTVDKGGRKPLLMIGSIGMAVGMLGLGTAAYLNELGILALIFILVFIASFAISWGPVVWVLISEIFPNTIRSKAMAIAVFAQWIFNFLISQTFPMLMGSDVLNSAFNGAFPFWIYGAMGILSFIFVWRMVPETKGRTLEEMEEIWEKKAIIKE